MSDDWGQELDAVVKSVPRVKAMLDVHADGQTILWLTFSASMMKDLGEPLKVRVLPGKGTNVGKVCIIVTDEGKVPVTQFEKGGGRIKMLPIEGMPIGYQFEAQPCEVDISKLTDKTIIVQLPVKEWNEAIAASELPKVSVSVLKAAAPEHNGGHVPGAILLDPIKYMKAKGRRLERINSSKWRLDGNDVDKPYVLQYINQLRKAADVPTIKMEEVDWT